MCDRLRLHLGVTSVMSACVRQCKGRLATCYVLCECIYCVVVFITCDAYVAWEFHDMTAHRPLFLYFRGQRNINHGHEPHPHFMPINILRFKPDFGRE